MKIESLVYEGAVWKSNLDACLEGVDIVFTFGERDTFKSENAYRALKKLYPKADIIGCSSSGNILNDGVSKFLMVATAISFSSSSSKVSVVVKDFTDSDDQILISRNLTDRLSKENLKHVIILSDGLNMNGSLLAKGANEGLGKNIPITGGLAGDNENFEETWVIANDIAKQKRVVAVGFYGDTLSISSGCYAGWEEFGIYRKITRSSANIVYEIDGQPALDLYKKYLGEYAENISANGLRFPFNVKDNENSHEVIRTVLDVDEKDKALIFAGDVPEGSMARLMKADIDSLINGAEVAAKNIAQKNKEDAFSLIVSCVGRKVILNQLVDEELESIVGILGDNVQLCGFYSYGELAPYSNEIKSCQLHNQTMTLTTIYED